MTAEQIRVQEQMKYAIIARVIDGIKRAADRMEFYENRDVVLAMSSIIGKLSYLNYGPGCCRDLDECLSLMERPTVLELLGGVK